MAALAGGISVDMREMDAIAAPSLEDLDVVVGAGVTRRALDTRLRNEGVFFAVDPGADATIGGMAATGASGTMTVRYGTMREKSKRPSPSHSRPTNYVSDQKPSGPVLRSAQKKRQGAERLEGSPLRSCGTEATETQ